MTGIRKGSRFHTLSLLEVGQRAYLETTADLYPSMMRSLNPTSSRRPAELQSKTFTTSLFTAVSASKLGDVRLLVCVERLS